MAVEKPKPKQLLRPITTGAGSAMKQSQFLAMTCNSLEAREKSRVQGAIGFCFDSHWLKNWRKSFKPITKRSNRNHVITFDSHLKTAQNRWLTLRLSGTLGDVYQLNWAWIWLCKFLDISGAKKVGNSVMVRVSDNNLSTVRNQWMAPHLILSVQTSVLEFC